MFTPIPTSGAEPTCLGHALREAGAVQNGIAGDGTIIPPAHQVGGSRHLLLHLNSSKINMMGAREDRAVTRGPPVLLPPGLRARLGLRPLFPRRGARTDLLSAGSGGPISVQSEALAPTTFFVAYFYRPW